MVTENTIDLVVVGSLHGDYYDQSQSTNYLPYCLARPSSVETLKQSSTASPDYARRNYVVSDSHSHGRIAAPKHKVQTRPNEVMHTVHIPRPISIAHDLVRQLLSHSSHRLHVLSHFENTPSPAFLSSSSHNTLLHVRLRSCFALAVHVGWRRDSEKVRTCLSSGPRTHNEVRFIIARSTAPVMNLLANVCVVVSVPRPGSTSFGATGSISVGSS